MKIEISPEIRKACPDLKLAVIRCRVQNGVTSDEFWQEMEAEIVRIRNTYAIEEINKRLTISATRQAYKTLGKDPNRYRPSAEALCRRIVRGIEIYKVSTLVDIINLVSIRSGFSIGGFDADKIRGDVVLGVGADNEEFEAIGRGLLNVEGLPLYRDEKGGIGTPTSDNERTKIGGSTTNLVMIINGYAGEKGLSEAVEHSKALFSKYAFLASFEVEYIS